MQLQTVHVLGIKMDDYYDSNFFGTSRQELRINQVLNNNRVLMVRFNVN